MPRKSTFASTRNSYMQNLKSMRHEQYSMNVVKEKREPRLPFKLILVYLFLEYARPQSFIPGLSSLHLPALTGVGIALALIISGKFQLRDKQSKLFLLLLSMMVIHGPIAKNNYWALKIFTVMIFLFLMYLSIVHFVDSEDKFNKLIKFWIIIHIFLALIGTTKGGRGIGGWLADENDFCMTINMILPFPIFLAFSTIEKTKKFYYYILAGLFLSVIILTKSRGGFVGLIALIIYFFFNSRKKVIMGLLIALFALLALLIAPSEYWDEVRSIKEETTENRPQYGTGAARIYTWNIAWHMFLDNPVLGVGQGNLPWNMGKYEIKSGNIKGFHERSFAGRAAHSLYFTLLPELGLIGTILFCGMIFYTFKDLHQIKNAVVNKKKILKIEESNKYYNLALALEGSLIAYFVSGIFISVLYYPSFWIMMGFIHSLRNILVEKSKNIKEEISPALTWNRFSVNKID
jgi:O-Antigen ligase